MTAIKKSVRLTARTIEALKPLSEVVGSGMNWSGSINAMAEQFVIFIDGIVPGLTKNQWSALYCCFEGHIPHQDIKQEAKMLSWYVSERFASDVQVDRYLDGDASELLKIIEQCSTPEKLAILYRVKKFWRQEPPVVVTLKHE